MAFKGFDNGAQKCNKRIPNDGMYRRLLSLGDRATTDELLELLKPLKEYPIHTLHFIDMIKFYDWVVEIDYEKQTISTIYQGTVDVQFNTNIKDKQTSIVVNGSPMILTRRQQELVFYKHTMWSYQGIKYASGVENKIFMNGNPGIWPII